ncbi:MULTISPECIES: TetR/AcrR family transcriptional regulator [unclassified Gilliamella]|uniref:TetR/AcrR family transcriptional regulator n=1 Tax=unclassified Gilliamella TaxID=2685620 RepID=UPI00130A9744|nr:MULTISPECIES: TetR/AcrR family transcriptional regulator [unclassified Gilliamella]MWP49866.1 TetR family transcriptional regulator [Gilliamella sp. Lep-s35]MWP68502.1 TetR family transcriptional regulator [Gilliamella sp. Lep-s5]MWP77963.1 TetR family transcriptional regulator [Gilliamella sp. Lep-s21]
MIQNNLISSSTYAGVKKRTYERLINTALEALEQGYELTITELADKSGISRATAYRYFPTQSDLIAAVVASSLGPIFSWHSQKQNVEEQLNDFLAFAFPQMLKHEGALRAALRLSLQQWATERASSSLQTKKLVRGNRKEILSTILLPLKTELPDEIYNQVIYSISIIYGSEIFMVLKDIWKLDNQQIISLTQWIAKAVINQARQDALKV